MGRQAKRGINKWQLSNWHLRFSLWESPRGISSQWALIPISHFLFFEGQDVQEGFRPSHAEALQPGCQGQHWVQAAQLLESTLPTTLKLEIDVPPRCALNQWHRNARHTNHSSSAHWLGSLCSMCFIPSSEPSGKILCQLPSVLSGLITHTVLGTLSSPCHLPTPAAPFDISKGTHIHTPTNVPWTMSQALLLGATQLIEGTLLESLLIGYLVAWSSSGNWKRGTNAIRVYCKLSWAKRPSPTSYWTSVMGKTSLSLNLFSKR